MKLSTNLAAFLAVACLIALSLFSQGQGQLAPTGCAQGETPAWNNSTKLWDCAPPGGGGGGPPAGSILLIVSGTCPSGYVEETTLNGKFLLGTLAANADIGSTGGADNITPAGTVSQPTFTGDALAAHAHAVGTYAVSAPTFTGTSSTVVLNHVHVQNVNSGTTGGQEGYGKDTSTNGSIATGLSTANPTGGSPSYTPAGTNSAPTLSGSSQSLSGGTPSGTVSQPTFTGTQFDNRSAFVRVIFCRKT